MDAASSSQFLKLYLRMTFGILLAVLAINVIVDPLWVYHKPWFPQRFVKDQRQSNPGVARFSRYDAVVIGNSLTENFRVAEMESCLGWRPVKLCVSGSTSLEQRLVLEQALATGQVRDVLWSLDLFSLSYGPDAVRVPDFPYHLYERGTATAARYLLSSDTLIKSCKVVLGAGPKDAESRHFWSFETKAGLAQVVANWRQMFFTQDFPLADLDLASRSVEKHFLEVIRSHPEIRFHFIVPPYSALYRVSELVGPENRFATRMEFKRELLPRLLEFPNVEVFDFENAHELTHDPNRYMDLIHYDLDVSSMMIGWMADGKYRLTLESVDDQIRQIEQDTRDYARRVFSADNPFRDQLRIEEFGLQLPTSISSAISETESNATQIAGTEIPQND